MEKKNIRFNIGCRLDHIIYLGHLVVYDISLDYKMQFALVRIFKISKGENFESVFHKNYKVRTLKINGNILIFVPISESFNTNIHTIFSTTK